MKKVANNIASVSALIVLSFPFIAHASDSQYVPGLKGMPPPGVYYQGYLANYSAEKNEALPDGSEVDVTALVNRAV